MWSFVEAEVGDRGGSTDWVTLQQGGMSWNDPERRVCRQSSGTPDTAGNGGPTWEAVWGSG